MNRCLKPAATLLLGALAVLPLTSPAWNFVREVPMDVVLGHLVVTQPHPTLRWTASPTASCPAPTSAALRLSCVWKDQ